MTLDEIKRVISITFIFSLVGIVILNIINASFDLTTIKGIKSAYSLSTIIILFWVYYIKHGWKKKLLQKILYRENLNGTWFGTYKSIDENNKEYKGYISIVINQDYLNIHVSSYTEYRKTESYMEKIEYNQKSGVNKLIYSYLQQDDGANNQDTRKGTSELTLSKYNNTTKLDGKFWTNGKTLGQMEVEKICENHIHIFNEAKKKYKEN